MCVYIDACNKSEKRGCEFESRSGEVCGRTWREERMGVILQLYNNLKKNQGNDFLKDFKIHK